MADAIIVVPYNSLWRDEFYVACYTESRLQRLLFVPLLAASYWIGYGVYACVLWLGWGQTASQGDNDSLFFWSGLAYGAVLIPLCLLTCSLIHKRCRIDKSSHPGGSHKERKL